MDPERKVWTLFSLLNMESPKVQKVSHWLSKFYVILEYLRFYLDLFPNSTMQPRFSNWWRFIKIKKSRSGPRHLPRLAVRSLRRSRTPQISMATLEDHLTSWPLGIPWWTTTISIWEFVGKQTIQKPPFQKRTGVAMYYHVLMQLTYSLFTCCWQISRWLIWLFYNSH